MVGADRKNFVFPLEVVDGWPPVAAEGLPFEKTTKGWRLLVPPLYVKKLSVDDVLQIEQRAGNVSSWKHVARSGNTTIWMLSLKTSGDKKALALLDKLNALGCQTVALPKLSSYSISVPAKLAIEKVDKILAKRKGDEVAVAYPSFRHAGADDPPALKDPDRQHPVAGSWRPTFTGSRMPSSAGTMRSRTWRTTCASNPNALPKSIERSITEYPETLVALSDKTWSSSIASWQDGYWQVLVDLWTAESGRSDLVLHARVFEARDGIRVVIESVHVP